jgi:NADH-quinone oxidoreductase subunit D
MASDSIETEYLIVNLGPQHPATHGVFRAELVLDGEVVIKCRPVLGYLHRGIEKLVEGKNYLQVIPYFDRLDYLSGFINEYPLVSAVEKLMEIEVPIRAKWIRVLMMELNRISAHLVNVGAQGLDLASMTPMVYTMRERETMLDLFTEVSGSRMTFNYFRFGGVRYDLPDHFLAHVEDFLGVLRKRIPEYSAMLDENEIFIARTKNVGVLSPELALDLGCSGPTLRGSGIPRDLRKDEPYEIYDELDFSVAVEKNGDSLSRYKVRFEELKQSASMVEQIIHRIPDGPVLAKVPKVIKPPPGDVYARVEAPIGELGVFLVSDGSPRPYRLKIRAPSLSNLMTLPYMIRGIPVPDVVATLASLAPTMGEADR